MRTGKLGPFDYIEDVSSTKEDLFVNSEDAGLGYNPWLTNQYFSKTSDTIFLSQDMNENSILSTAEQHKFYSLTVKKLKRRVSWNKEPKDEILTYLGKHYGINKDRAKEVFLALGPETSGAILIEMKNQENGRIAGDRTIRP